MFLRNQKKNPKEFDSLANEIIKVEQSIKNIQEEILNRGNISEEGIAFLEKVLLKKLTDYRDQLERKKH